MTTPTWPVICATGHRPQYLAPAAQRWVRAELTRLAVRLRDEHGMVEAITGMALGTDLWWGGAAHDAGVPIAAYIPFPRQAKPWPLADRQDWQRLRDVAARERIFGDAYSVTLLHARNDGMLADADAVVAVWDPTQTRSGTKSTFGKAVARRMPIIWINPVSRVVRLVTPKEHNALPTPERTPV